MATKRTHKMKAKKAMKDLGIYKDEFDKIIGVYAELMEQYDFITEEFVNSGFNYETPTGKKTTSILVLESLRKDILSYSKDLGLTPQGLLKFDEMAFKQEKESNFTNILGALID